MIFIFWVVDFISFYPSFFINFWKKYIGICLVVYLGDFQSVSHIDRMAVDFAASDDEYIFIDFFSVFEGIF